MPINLLVLLLVLLCPSLTWAAVACNDANAVSNEDAAGPNPITISYTYAGGTNAVAFHFAGYRRGGGTLTYTAKSWNGVGSTSLTTHQYTDPAGGEAFYNLTPATGTVSATASTTVLASVIAAWVCTGVNTVSPTHDAISTTGTGTTASTTVTNVLASDVVIACMSKDGNEAITPGGSLVEIKKDASPTEMNGGCFYQDGTAGGAVSITWTGSQQWTIHAWAVSAALSDDGGGGVLWFP